ncbi:unnamed protein product [Triticum turgidum subsp. durum]|uniref:Uncharacterized protein n=1 Tax=Triticum turgidum subsp. durum TaxID=4567 RepID=A0A9R1PXI0_TRITD|nr:unnamed protein product [Triticum turgidum subsp. durum]
MDEHMGRRTVGGLLFTKGGSILLFREDSSRRKAGACCSRNGCNGTRHSADKGRPMHSHREAASAAAKEAAPTPRRSQPVRKPPQGSSNPAGPCSETDNGTGEAAAPGAGRDLLARLKDRVNASRKRSLAREMSSPSSSSGGFSASSSGGGATRSSAVSRPTRRAASRIRKADEGESAGGSRRVPRRDTGGGGGARGNSDDPVMVGQRAAREQAPTEGFISGFLARYRGSLQGGSSLQDGAEDSSGYWRFDVEGSEEVKCWRTTSCSAIGTER